MRDHKSLLAWQAAREVVLTVNRACRSGWIPHAATLLRQLQRSCLSVQLNIAEGHALGQRRQFCYHLRVAYGSAVETAELLELLLAEKVLPKDQVEAAVANCRRAQGLVLGLLHRYQTAKRPTRS